MGLLYGRVSRLLMVSAVFSAGCTNVVAGRPAAFSLDRAAAIEALARTSGTDWSAQRLASPALASAQRARRSPDVRRLLGLGTVFEAASGGFGGVAGAGGRVTSAPAYAWAFGQVFWLTDSGWLLRYTMKDGQKAAFQVSATDTFDNTSITLSADARRAYLMSRQGNFYVLDTQTGAKLGASPYALGGADANATAVAPPWVDVLAGRPDGQAETVYALTNAGGLTRFAISAPKGGATTITKAQTYTLPRDTADPYTEIYQSAPIVVLGKAVLGTYRRHKDTASMHQGYLRYYDTGCTGPTASATTGAIIRSVGLTGPVWAPAAVEFNDSLVPVYAFVPTGYVVTMVDLPTGDKAESPPLIVNQTTPVSGSLFGYPYGTSGVSTIEKSAVSGGGVSVADDDSLILPETGKTWDGGKLYATKVFDGDVSTPIWGYIKYYLAKSDLVVGGTERAVIDAQLELKCNSSSNATGSSNPAPLRMFEVSDNLTTGVYWDENNLRPTNRPPFEDGAKFSHANLNGHKSVECLPNAGNSFKTGQKYRWSAKGRVSTGDTYYSFGLAHDELPYNNTASNNGQPFKTSAPRFDGGTNPRLFVTLSGEGFATPTMANPVTIDSWNHRVFVLNTNCLYQVSFASPTYDGTDPYNALAFGERKANFGDPAQTYFHLTRLGQDTDSPGKAGPLATSPSKQYVANVTAPLFNGTTVWAQDNHPGFNRTAITEFTPGTPPTQVESVLLPDTNGDAKKGATYMTYDWDGTKLFLGTWDTTSGSTKGRAWVLNQ